MIVRDAEVRFRQGLQQLERGRVRDALPLLASAVKIQQGFDGSGFIQATYRSYHGLCQVLAGSEMYRGLRDCRRASKSDPTNPAILFNLGRAALVLKRRKEAHRAFQRGLQVQPGHPGITRALKTMGVRRRPFLDFLPRGSFVNVMLGRMCTWFRSRPAPKKPVKPVETAEPAPAPRVESLDPITRSA